MFYGEAVLKVRTIASTSNFEVSSANRVVSVPFPSTNKMNRDRSTLSPERRHLTNESIMRIQITLSSRKSSVVVFNTYARLVAVGNGRWDSVAVGAPCILLVKETSALDSRFQVRLAIAEVETGISIWEEELASEKVPSMEIVVDRLLYEEKKSKDRHGATMIDQGEALVVRNNSKWKRGIRCHCCGKLGHIQKDCWKNSDKSKKYQQKPGVKKKNEEGNSIGLIASEHALAAESDSQVNNWIIDSGATCHICCNKTMFDEIHDMDKPQTVTLGDGKNIETIKRGTVKLKLKQVNGSYKKGTLHDVLYVPELSFNLLSIAKTTSLGKTVSLVISC